MGVFSSTVIVLMLAACDHPPPKDSMATATPESPEIHLVASEERRAATEVETRRFLLKKPYSRAETAADVGIEIFHPDGRVDVRGSLAPYSGHYTVNGNVFCTTTTMGGVVTQCRALYLENGLSEVVHLYYIYDGKKVK